MVPSGGPVCEIGFFHTLLLIPSVVQVSAQLMERFFLAPTKLLFLKALQHKVS